MLAACVNVASLLFARGLARRGELAVRAVLGAGRARLASDLLAEAALLSLLGLALSVPVALATQHLLIQFALPFGTPLDYDLRMDGRALTFAACAAGLTTIAAGLFPALRTSRLDLRSAIRGAGVVFAHRTSFPGQLLIAVQVALSLVLLVGTGLFRRSLEQYAKVDPGFRVDGVLVMNVDFNAESHRFDEARAMRVYAAALERIRRVPEVKAASWAGDVPLGIRQILIRFFPEPRAVVNEDEWRVLNCDVVSSQYFRTLGIPLEGRDFTDADDQLSHEVAVVNETLARRYWPGLDPIGRSFKVSGRTGVKTVEVIGVAADVRQRSLGEPAQPRLYLALSQRYFPEMTLHVLVNGSPRDALPRVRAELSAVEDNLPVFGARTLEDQMRASLSRPRMAAALLGAAALITVVLSAVGIYGVAARSSVARWRELGIRMALGARPADVLWLALRRGMAPVTAGLALGSAAALALGLGLQAFLFGVLPSDIMTHAVSVLLLATVAGLATFAPARRAVAGDPITALRHE